MHLWATRPFSIQVNGDFANLLARAQYNAGGYDLENKIWNNMIANVRKACSAKH